MIPVAGVGLTWLCLNQISPCFGSPLAGFIPLMGMMMCYYGKATGSPIKIGKFTIPGVCMIKTRHKPATKAGKRICFGKEMKVKAKPARTVVKAFAVAALKKSVK